MIVLQKDRNKIGNIEQIDAIKTQEEVIIPIECNEEYDSDKSSSSKNDVVVGCSADENSILAGV